MILLITGTFDDECDAVVKALKASGNKAFFRLNADRLYDFYFVDVDLASNAFTLRHRYTGQTLHSHEVKTVWWARYTLPAATWEFFDAHLSAYIDDEYYSSLIALMACLDEEKVRIINHPVRHLIAGHKPYQQIIAAECGLKLPRQRITNELSVFLKQDWSRKAVYKPVSNSQYLTKGRNKYFATVKQINPSLYNSIKNKEVDMYVHHFQEQLAVKKEYRVTVFGESVFAFRIDGDYDFDWRRYLDKIKFTYMPQFAYQSQCIAYMKKMGIHMGCFDFIETTDGNFYFLECNAPGYFLFCDPRNKHGLAKRFAEFLLH